MKKFFRVDIFCDTFSMDLVGVFVFFNFLYYLIIQPHSMRFDCRATNTRLVMTFNTDDRDKRLTYIVL